MHQGSTYRFEFIMFPLSKAMEGQGLSFHKQSQAKRGYERMKTMQQPIPALRWVANKRQWIVHTYDESLYVDEDTYHRMVTEYLASRGIQYQTWSEYLHPAEEAWKRQCELQDGLRANLDYWKQVPGVRVVPRSRQS